MSVPIITEVTTAELAALVSGNLLKEGLQYKNTDTDDRLLATSINTYTRILSVSEYGVTTYIKTIEIPHSQILTLPTSHVELVEPQGLGKVIIPKNMIIYASYPTVEYTNVSTGCLIGIPFSEWGNLDSAAFMVIDAEASPIFGAGAASTDPWLIICSVGFNLGDQNTIQVPQNFLSNVSNESLVLKCVNSGGNFTGGAIENKLVVKIFYDIVQF